MNTIEVEILKDGYKAKEIKSIYKDRIFKIQDMMLGIGENRKPVHYSKHSLKAGGTHQAEILPNGKIRII